jgi:putative heme-binding domain-containing protein
MDRLERDGASYLAKGEPDLFTANDAWCMPVALKIGPDGSLYILDWYDRYHCSQDAARDPDGVDRSKGRLYRLRYKNTPRAPRIDLLNESDQQLVTRLGSGNIYLRETAQRILTERLAGASAELRANLESAVMREAAPRKERLHALWTLIGSGSLRPAFHLQLLAHKDSAYRAWGVRAAGNYGEVTGPIRTRIAKLARDRSPDVQLQVAIASRKLKELDALPVLNEVLASCGQDKLIPSIAWNNLHPLLDETRSARWVSLMTASGRLSPAQAALSSRMIDRFLSASHPVVDGASIAGLVGFIAEHDADRAKECLSSISAKLADLSAAGVAQLRADLAPLLRRLLAHESDAPLYLGAQLLAARLGLIKIDSAAIRDRFSSAAQPEASRLQALDAMIAFRDAELLKLLPAVLSTSTPQFTRRAFAALGRVEDVKLAEVILEAYPQLAPELQPLAIDLIMQREKWARKLLDAVLADQLPKSVLNANHLRKILESNDREALWAVEKAFGRVREERNPEREQVVAQMASHFRAGNMGDPRRGEKVFSSLCAQCHTIYGKGGKVGPDLTSDGRASFDQLLSNVFDPSLVIGPAYQVTTVVTKDGRNLTGLIAEDNDQRVVIRMPGGGDEVVPRNGVKYLRASKLSMMPEGLEAALDKKDLADLFAFLALDKPPDDPQAKLIPGAPPLAKADDTSGVSPLNKSQEK